MTSRTRNLKMKAFTVTPANDYVDTLIIQRATIEWQSNNNKFVVLVKEHVDWLILITVLTP